MTAVLSPAFCLFFFHEAAQMSGRLKHFSERACLSELLFSFKGRKTSLLARDVTVHTALHWLVRAPGLWLIMALTFLSSLTC